MFALYHLNSSYWLCQEWIAVAQSWAEGNLCYCVIFPPQTNQTEVFFCKQISKSKTSAPVSHTDRGHQRKRAGQSHQLYLSTSQSGLPRSFLCPNRAVSQTWENGRCFPQLQLAAGLCWTGRGRKEILLLCPWAMLNCFSKTDTGLRPCFMAAIELGKWDGCWLGNWKDGYIERRRWRESGGPMAKQLIAVRIVKKVNDTAGGGLL